MVNSSLPLYKTGWFYLLISFWLVCYWGLSIDYFAQINQFNFQLYSFNQLSPMQNLPLTLSTAEQGLWMKALHALSFISGVSLLWYSRGLSKKFQWQLLTVFFLLLILSQYFFISYGFWFSLAPTITIVSLSWFFIYAYQKESDQFLTIEKQYNQLLFNTLEEFSATAQLDKIKYYLELSKASPNLVEKIYQLANNSALNNNHQHAKYLYHWIENSGIPHKATQEKLQGYRKETLHIKAGNLIAQQAGVTAADAVISDAKNNKTAQNYTAERNTKQNINKINWGSSAPNQMPNKATNKAHNKAHNKAEHVDHDQKTAVIRDEISSEDELEKTLVISSQHSADIPLESTQVIRSAPQASPVGTPAHFSHKTFGRYKVEGLLGKGAMGIVYQGIDPKINRHVAIKTLQLSDSIDQVEITKAKQRFFREAETAGGLSHANIVTIYDVGDEGSLGYIAMDLLTGAPLSHFIKQNNLLPVPLIYQLMIQITDALEYAHRQNVVHRDIKPANIIYDDDLQKVTITDFGIACVNDNSRTSTGVIMGSPYYMSPEQILGKQVDGRSDIFSLGATLYQLLSGCLPFEGDSVVSVVYQISNEKHIAITKQNDALPPSALRITNKAMQKDTEKRYQSMQEFKQALINALKRDYKQVPII